MKHLKSFLVATALTLCISSATYANSNINILPNSIPGTGQFNLHQQGGNVITFIFPKPMRATEFLCYFDPPLNNQISPEVSALIDSDDADITYTGSSSDNLGSGKGDVVMFSVKAQPSAGPMAHVHFTLQGNTSHLGNLKIAIKCVDRLK